MPNYCPFCAAPLAATDDAFCGECRSQLDEAPPPNSTPADIELRRKISHEEPRHSIARITSVFLLLAFAMYVVRFLIILASQFAQR